MLSLLEMYSEDVIGVDEFRFWRQQYRIAGIYVDLHYTPEYLVDDAETELNIVNSSPKSSYLYRSGAEKTDLLLEIAMWLESKQLGGM